MTEVISKIPARVKNAAVGGHVCGVEDIIDDNKNKTQEQINSEVEQNLGDGTVDSRIQQAKTDIIGGATSNGNTLKKVENRVVTLESAVGSGGSVDSRIAASKSEILGSAGADYNSLGKVENKLKEESNTRSTNYYTKEEVNGLITTPDQNYVTVEATDQTTDVTTLLPAPGAADTIYRVGNWDGTQYDTSCYTEYSWNTSTNRYIKLSTKAVGPIDVEPTKDSDNLVKSGGVEKYVRENYTGSDEKAYYSDLDITDDDYNVIARFKEGHIKTRNFDSKEAAKKSELIIVDNVEGNYSDFSIADDKGNVIVAIKNNNFVDTDKGKGYKVSKIFRT